MKSQLCKEIDLFAARADLAKSDNEAEMRRGGSWLMSRLALGGGLWPHISVPGTGHTAVIGERLLGPAVRAGGPMISQTNEC